MKASMLWEYAGRLSNAELHSPGGSEAGDEKRWDSVQAGSGSMKAAPFRPECRAVTNRIGNGVATVLIGRWEGEVSAEEVRRQLSGVEPAAAWQPVGKRVCRAA
jgi:hypothetical protein